jgi:hypothetical protein
MDRKRVKIKLYKILVSLRKENKSAKWYIEGFDDFIEAMRWEINQHLEYNSLNEID